MEEEKVFQIALSLVPQIGIVNARRLISYLGSAQQVFQSSTSALQKVPHIGPLIAHEIKVNQVLEKAEKIYADCQKEQIQLFFYLDEAYPHRLKQLYDAPLLLYFKGNANFQHDKVMALVGTRKATEYGREMTYQIVKDALDDDVLFVSGLAYGIDIALHQACIELKIPTIAVLAGGFQCIYPSLHIKYAHQMMDLGGILSEHPFHQKPDPRFFPLRNRIIAGMSDATIVVEAAEKGGALITAEYANNYHRDVFAVPGNLQKVFSEGCNRLILKNQATIYTDWHTCKEQLNWQSNPDKIVKNKSLLWSRLTEDESQILSLLHQEKVLALDEIAWKLQKGVNQLAMLLLNLEFQGFIKAWPGHRYGLK
ncbi:DNA-processing protein DprA [Aquirufa aurantiipilula]|uniref:DNA-processing protein DprA n=1 Tax=Aquirufa aurantiipilula TaxID=2696561 RepID=UPI001CAA7E10|nr:DNA-processing protein DprA [Aquirufa aurantiipilula]MBZ1325288.1 DNA-protecting protein DprA [Aquirufa aurantiipilula]